tara:strand:- start:489 stop:866 length:378 start_codon:yes stop_codon:yes gene_type:complete
MGGAGGSYSKSSSRNSSGVQYYGGQEDALSRIFSSGGAFDQFMGGKPNAGFERAQSNSLEQLKRQQSQAGTLNSPLGTRQQSDFLQKTTQAAGDDWLTKLFSFMQPAGTKSEGKSSSLSLSGNVG